MIRIMPYPLWVGHGGEVSDMSRLLDRGIEAVVVVAAEESPPSIPRDLIACRFPLVDGTGNRPELLLLAVRTVAALISAEVPTFVSCGAGMSRAPAVAAAALALAHDEPPEVCLKWVASHHPHDVSTGLWRDLVTVLSKSPTSGPAVDRP